MYLWYLVYTVLQCRIDQIELGAVVFHLFVAAVTVFFRRCVDLAVVGKRQQAIASAGVGENWDRANIDSGKIGEPFQLGKCCRKSFALESVLVEIVERLAERVHQRRQFRPTVGEEFAREQNVDIVGE